MNACTTPGCVLRWRHPGDHRDAAGNRFRPSPAKSEASPPIVTAPPAPPPRGPWPGFGRCPCATTPAELCPRCLDIYRRHWGITDGT